MRAPALNHPDQEGGWTNPGASLGRGMAKVALALTLGFLAFIGDAQVRAQCSAGDYIGACPAAGVDYAGCCPTANTVQWCEGTALCGLNCSGNTGTSSCCTPSSSAGCGDTSVESCVCAIDDYCCDTWFGEWDAFCVDIAANDCGACAGGGGPPIFCGWLTEEGFYDCKTESSSDPTGQHPATCGGGCVKQCGGKQCGPDGCGGICGQCGANQVCNASGQCAATCATQCAGKSCGPDGCGGVCGQCLSTETCSAAGQCVGSCTPQCGSKVCGPDGCGGVCGQCTSSQTCTAAGQCVGNCTPQCAGKDCGDDGCGGTCGTCLGTASCQSGTCVAECVPSCAGKQCGDDGCGGSCGTCGSGETCGTGGQCGSSCSCAGRQCGDDGCGRVCGYCIAGTTCNTGTFTCEKANTDPEPDQGTVVEPVECPVGQIWSAYAGKCVLDANGNGTAASSNDGCAGGRAAGLGGLVLALFGLASRRARLRAR